MPTPSCRWFAFVFLLLSLTPAVRAADGQPAAAPDQASAAAATTPAPTPPPSLWEQSTLTGDWGGWRDRMGNIGFAPFASWTGEIWGDVSGSFRHRPTQNMLLSWGFETDLEKAAGWKGASFRASFNWVEGLSPNKNLGAFNSPTYIDAADQVRVFNLFLRQNLFGDQLKLKAGLMGADDDFFQCDTAALFLNAGITAPPIFYGQTLANGDLSMPQYAVDGPGAFARYEPKDWPVYIMTAVYASDAGPDVSNNHGFEWGGSNSVVVVAEAGWKYAAWGRAGVVKGGAYYNDGQFTNWDTGRPERGIYGAYALVNQNFIQTTPTDGSDPAALLSAYAYAGWAGPDNRVTPNFTCSMGVSYKCGSLGRPNDTAGVAVLYTGFSSDYTQSVFNPYGAGFTNTSETDLEFTYQAAIFPWFTLQPDVQVVINPAYSAARDTVVVGTRAVVTF